MEFDENSIKLITKVDPDHKQIIFWLLKSYSVKPNFEVLRQLREIYDPKFSLKIHHLDQYFKYQVAQLSG